MTDDYIKREDAIRLAKDIVLPSGAITENHTTKPIVIWRCIDADEVMDIPSANVRKNVKGHWVVDRYCSVCDFDKYEADCCCGGLPQNFCPNCGADMRGEA